MNIESLELDATALKSMPLLLPPFSDDFVEPEICAQRELRGLKYPSVQPLKIPMTSRAQLTTFTVFSKCCAL